MIVEGELCLSMVEREHTPVEGKKLADLNKKIMNKLPNMKTK
jgi:hypothetical protein